MKKLLVLIIAMLFAPGAFSQEKFQVPEVSSEKKHASALFQYDAILVASIGFAKEQGLTALEFGELIGNKFKKDWNKEAGFAGFVKGALYNMTCCKEEGSEITILTNTPEKVKFKAKPTGIWIKKNEPVYGVSYQEYTDYFSAVLKTIGNYLGAESEFTFDGEWFYLTLTKL